LPLQLLLPLQFIQVGLVLYDLLIMIHLPLMLTLLLQFGQVSLVLYDLPIMIHLPLMLMLPLQFCQVSLMLQFFHLPLLLQLLLQFSNACSVLQDLSITIHLPLNLYVLSMCCMLTVLFGISILLSHNKLLMWCKYPIVLALMWTTTILHPLSMAGLKALVKSLLPVDSGHRRSSRHRHHHILFPMLTATVL
jgi:hypothetical protein